MRFRISRCATSIAVLAARRRVFYQIHALKLYFHSKLEYQYLRDKFRLTPDVGSLISSADDSRPSRMSLILF